MHLRQLHRTLNFLIDDHVRWYLRRDHLTTASNHFDFVFNPFILAGASQLRINNPVAFAPTLILLAVALLYGGYLSSPMQFDDIGFFAPGVIDRYVGLMGPYPRHLALGTLVLGDKWFGTDLVWFRAVSLILHAGVAIALYFLLREMQRILPVAQANAATETLSSLAGPHLLALLAALTFALHPAAVYGAGYLIQRTIVMATFFSLLSWFLLLHGLRTEKRRWLWASVVAFFLAVLSKEHAVVAPAVGVALGIWWWRSQSGKANGRDLLYRVLPMAASCFLISAWVVLNSKDVVGYVYELAGREMLGSIPTENAMPLSVVTQAMLFFKYLTIWLLPNPMAMSVDMREPFASSLASWPYMAAAAAFVLWVFTAIWLLWKGGRRGLLGFAMLAPALLFATEFAAVRIQEIFVIYRSYLWLAPAFSAILLLDRWVKGRALIALTAFVPLFLFPLALNRLTTFSHPLLLWDDAVRLVEGKTGLPGLERIYRNRGVELYHVKKHDLAIQDYSKAISLNPSYSPAYNDRGAVLLELNRMQDALADFDNAIRLDPQYPNSQVGRARALEALGRAAEAKENYKVACKLGWQSACAKL